MPARSSSATNGPGALIPIASPPASRTAQSWANSSKRRLTSTVVRCATFTGRPFDGSVDLLDARDCARGREALRHRVRLRPRAWRGGRRRSRRVAIASASATGSSGRTSTPLSPSVTASRSPPTAGAITGTPSTSASITLTGRPSWCDASTKRSAPAISRVASSRYPSSVNRSPSPSVQRVPRRTSASSGPCPAAAKRTGIPRSSTISRGGEQARVVLLRAQVRDRNREHLTRPDAELGPYRISISAGGADAVHGRRRARRPRRATAARVRSTRERHRTPRWSRRSSGRWRGWRFVSTALYDGQRLCSVYTSAGRRLTERRLGQWARRRRHRLGNACGRRRSDRGG